MSAPETPRPDGYVHARDDDEYQRLRSQAAMWRGATETLLDRRGLKPGMSCLDVGAGPGLVMRLMADRVGPDGTVTGLEADGDLVWTYRHALVPPRVSESADPNAANRHPDCAVELRVRLWERRSITRQRHCNILHSCSDDQAGRVWDGLNII